MTFRGTIDHGRLVLDDGTTLPHGTRVDVEVTRRRAKKSAKPKAKLDPIATIASLAVPTGDPNFSDNHNYYAYGVGPAPKLSRPKRPARKTKKRGSRRAR